MIKEKKTLKDITEKYAAAFFDDLKVLAFFSLILYWL